MPVAEGRNVALRGSAVEEEHRFQLGDGETDPDLIDAIKAVFSEEEKGKTNENSLRDILEDLTSFRWLRFYSVPKVKFAINFFFYLGYMVYAAFVLMFYGAEGEVTSWEVFLWVWAISREVGEFFELDEYSLTGLRTYIRDWWNRLDNLTFLLIMAAAAVRLSTCGLELGGGGGGEGGGGEGGGEGGREGGACAGRGAEWAGDSYVDYLPRSVYALGVLIIFLRLMQFLKYQHNVGVLLIVIGAMKSDVQYFMVIMGVLAAGFGISFAVLLPASMTAPWYQVFGDNVLWGPFWGILGGFGNVNGPVELEGGHEPTITLAPMLLWTYLFIATIILINLLIAQMADTFGRVTAEGQVRWLFERTALISEYKDTKPPLPPPLNLVSVAYYCVEGTVRYLSKLFKGETKEEWPSTIGFKKVPPNMELRSLERREQAALKECLRQRSRRHEESAEGVREKLQQTLSKLEEQNRTRFDNVNGRLDNIMRVLDFQLSHSNDLAINK